SPLEEKGDSDVPAEIVVRVDGRCFVGLSTDTDEVLRITAAAGERIGRYRLTKIVGRLIRQERRPIEPLYESCWRLNERVYTGEGITRRHLVVIVVSR